MKGWPVAVILCSTNLKVWICSESYISYVLGVGTCRSKWLVGVNLWEEQTGSTRALLGTTHPWYPRTAVGQVLA